MLAELRNLNWYLGDMIPSLSRVECDSETGRVMMQLAESDPIWSIRVSSELETCSLPSMPAVKLRLPKLNSTLGMKVIALMLIGAIEPAGTISTTPLPGAPTIDVCYWQYNLYGGSSDRKSDGSTRHSKQDAVF